MKGQWVTLGDNTHPEAHPVPFPLSGGGGGGGGDGEIGGGVGGGIVGEEGRDGTTSALTSQDKDLDNDNKSNYMQIRTTDGSLFCADVLYAQ